MAVKLEHNNEKHHLTSVHYKNIIFLQKKEKNTNFTSNMSKDSLKLENKLQTIIPAPKSSLKINKTHKLIM